MTGAPRELSPGTRFLAWVAGLDQLLLGLAMLVVPSQFDNAHYAVLQPHLFLYGILAAASGIGLLIWQILPLERARFPEASLAFAAIVYGLLAHGFLRAGGWTEAGTNGLLAGALLSRMLATASTTCITRPPRPFDGGQCHPITDAGVQRFVGPRAW